MLNRSYKIKIYHFKLKTELFTVAIYKGLNKIKFLRRVQLCQGNLDWRQGILSCPVCMNPADC